MDIEKWATTTCSAILTKAQASGGTPVDYAAATAGVLTAHLGKALARIERMEGDIQLLTDLIADLEAKDE